MPKIPRPSQPPRRVVVRYAIQSVDGIYWAKAFDQSNTRYPEADLKGSPREAIVELARYNVNNSYSAEEQ